MEHTKEMYELCKELEGHIVRMSNSIMQAERLVKTLRQEINLEQQLVKWATVADEKNKIEEIL